MNPYHVSTAAEINKILNSKRSSWLIASQRLALTQAKVTIALLASRVAFKGLKYSEVENGWWQHIEHPVC
ncbi:MAG TPA: hypothetical protein DEP36_03945 [Gammaproteobacteria bacterium]|nr:hypothetical protein [Gammaproteobacteria bacterium]HRF43044.1 hypothetical protein [Candidatus Competibacteraceae bacterium]